MALIEDIAAWNYHDKRGQLAAYLDGSLPANERATADDIQREIDVIRAEGRRADLSRNLTTRRAW